MTFAERQESIDGVRDPEIGFAPGARDKMKSDDTLVVLERSVEIAYLQAHLPQASRRRQPVAVWRNSK